MKKLALVLSLVFMTTALTAQTNQSLFGREKESSESKFGPGLPGHGGTGNQDAPVGAGVALLISFGAAYAMYKKSKKD